MESEIILSVGGFPPLSARGCTQEISPIIVGEFSRTVNGELIYVGLSEKKYKTTIECEDQNGVAFDGIEIGMDVTVSCIQRFWQHVKPIKILKNESSMTSDENFLVKNENAKNENAKNENIIEPEIFDLIEKTNLIYDFKKENKKNESEKKLSKKEKKFDVFLEKKPRKNSVFKIDVNKNIEDINEKVNGKLVEKIMDNSEFFISYLPELEMKITNFKVSTNEWTQKTKWKIEMEEI